MGLPATVSTLQTTSGFVGTGSSEICRRPTSETVLDGSTRDQRPLDGTFSPKIDVRQPFPAKPEVEIWRKPHTWTRSHRLPIRLCIHYGVYLDSFCHFVDDIVSIGPLWRRRDLENFTRFRIFFNFQSQFAQNLRIRFLIFFDKLY